MQTNLNIVKFNSVRATSPPKLSEEKHSDNLYTQQDVPLITHFNSGGNQASGFQRVIIISRQVDRHTDNTKSICLQTVSYKINHIYPKLSVF